MGVSPFGDSYKVWMSKVHPTGDSKPTERMQVGIDSEDFVLNQFEKKFNTRVTDKQRRVYHFPESWAGCTLDGLAEVDGRIAVVEAKTISTPLYIEPPIYYVLQVLWQQWVTGTDRGYLAVWSTKDCAFKAYEIHIGDHHAELLQAVHDCKRFWEEHVLTKTAPERKVTERNLQDLPNELLNRYCEIQDAQKELENEKKNLRQQIVEALGCPTELKVKSDRFQVDIVSQVTRLLNKERLEKDNPGITEKYVEPQTTQKVVIKRIGITI
jgi:hypothetical protein